MFDTTIAIAIPSAVFCHEMVSEQDDVHYLGSSWALVINAIITIAVQYVIKS